VRRRYLRLWRFRLVGRPVNNLDTPEVGRAPRRMVLGEPGPSNSVARGPALAEGARVGIILRPNPPSRIEHPSTPYPRARASHQRKTRIYLVRTLAWQTIHAPSADTTILAFRPVIFIWKVPFSMGLSRLQQSGFSQLKGTQFGWMVERFAGGRVPVGRGCVRGREWPGISRGSCVHARRRWCRWTARVWASVSSEHASVAVVSPGLRMATQAWVA
jgi:hypothetical protein